MCSVAIRCRRCFGGWIGRLRRRSTRSLRSSSLLLSLPTIVPLLLASIRGRTLPTRLMNARHELPKQLLLARLSSRRIRLSFLRYSLTPSRLFCSLMCSLLLRRRVRQQIRQSPIPQKMLIQQLIHHLRRQINGLPIRRDVRPYIRTSNQTPDIQSSLLLCSRSSRSGLLL